MTFKKLHRNIKIRIIEHFLTVMIGNAIFPFMAIYFHLKLGAKITGIALLINVFVGLIASLYGGHLADKYGRKVIMLKAEYIRFFALAIMALASTTWFDSPWIMYFTLIVLSACLGLARPASEALIVDSSTPENREYIYSIRYWSYHVAIIVGAAGGALFFKSHLFFLLIIITLISLISLILIKFFITDLYEPEDNIKKKNTYVFKEIYTNYKTVISDSLFKTFLFASLIYLSLETQFHNYTAVRYDNLISNFNLLHIGKINIVIDGIKIYAILNIINGLVVVIGGLFITKMIKNLSNKQRLSMGLFIYSLGYAILAVNLQPWNLIFIMILVTIGELIFIPSIQAKLADIVPEQKRSSYLAINGLVFRIASMIGTLSITIGAYLSAYLMGIIIFMGGLISISLFIKVYKTDDQSKFINRINES